MPWSPLPYHQDGPPDPVPLRESIDQVLAGLGAPTVDHIRTVHDRWDELVGTGVADHAQPASIEHGQLVVTVDDPAWASQLRWAEPDLLRRLEAVLGAEVVTSVVTRVRRG